MLVIFWADTEDGRVSLIYKLRAVKSEKEIKADLHEWLLEASIFSGKKVEAYGWYRPKSNLNWSCQ